MPINNKYVGENIARLRVSFRMTQQQLAAALGVSHQAVSKWETGAALPDIESLLNISRLFGVTMEQLLKQPAEPEQAAEDAKDEPLFDPDVVEGLKEAAKRTAQTASEIGNAIFSRVGGALSNAFDACKSALGGDEDDEEEDAEEDDGAEESAFAPEAKDGADESPMSLEALVDLAPFMSREKISAMVEAYQGPIDRKTLLHLAPFLTQETL
ncbi:MAG: helix-turn-helix transcriptional regulator, partial [Clostridia bacterium]|nr:helix-turn-helix transcriptional regulator [Clostridia bacterium]